MSLFVSYWKGCEKLILKEIKENSRLCVYKKFLYANLILGVIGIVFSIYYTLWLKVPSTIMVKAGVDQTLDFNLPASGMLYKDAITTSSTAGSTKLQEKTSIPVNLNAPVTVKASLVDTYKLQLKLFGVLPFKEVDVEVIQDIKLKPVGMPIGIYVKTQGVLVVGIGDFEGEDGQSHYPAKYILKPGDYIMEMNDEEIMGKKQLIERISHCEGQEVVFKIKRDEQEFYVKAKPQPNRNGEYKMGIWVRDNAQGVGTMTYVDENGCFGALGHGINDIDTSTLMKLKSGTLYNTEIISITKGQNGSPGELTGFIEYDDRNILGSINMNTPRGVFGICSPEVINSVEADYLSIGLKQEIEIGPAQIICSLGEEVQTYQAEIIGIHLENDNINRGIVLKITDPVLLEKTGGIVQGMSGSPIIQNGKIIGAVTHVLVNDPEKGYGIFIENMLEH